jgi:hypothetical protein
MEGPRAPQVHEWPALVDFLNSQLRPNFNWSITSEYPLALTPRNLHNMCILAEEAKLVSHAVLRPIIVKSPRAILKVAAIGSVVTDEAHRGKGHSRQVISECLKQAVAQDCDLAILWTHLHDFYRKLGFELAGIEESYVIEHNFTPLERGLRFMEGSQISAEALFRLYNQHTVTSYRTAEDIRKYLTIPNSRVHTAWGKDGKLKAYAVEGKGADLKGYVHEWGGLIPDLMALLAHVRTQGTTPLTMIVPKHSNNLKAALSEVAQRHNTGFLGMIKILNEESLFAKVQRAAHSLGYKSFLLQKKGDCYQFGSEKDFIEFTDVADLVRVLFGPEPEIPEFTQTTKQMVQHILPLPLWIWGWDSI